MTTMSYPICVFLDSCAQVRLSVDHPFYYLVYETFDYFMGSPFLLRDAAGYSFQDPQYNEAAKKERAEEIKKYMRTNSPTVSGSDSPALKLTALVKTRAYSGCGKDRKNKKPARKHVYIQKSLVDAWMNSHSAINSGKTGQGHHL
jgi:hypothetical protein